MVSTIWKYNDKNTYDIVVDGKSINNPRTIDKASNTIKIKQDYTRNTKMDIVFTVGTTRSISVKIHFLKSELLDVIARIQEYNEDKEYRTRSIFYRDVGSEFFTRIYTLPYNKTNIIDFVNKQNKSSGEDKLEAVEHVLDETMNLDWDVSDEACISYPDCTKHKDEETIRKIRYQIEDASVKRIKLIPITVSGFGRKRVPY